MNSEKNMIFIAQDGFAYGAIATLITDSVIELKIPTATEIDFDGKCRIRIDGSQLEGAVPLASRAAPYWHVTFKIAEDDDDT